MHERWGGVNPDCMQTLCTSSAVKEPGVACSLGKVMQVAGCNGLQGGGEGNRFGVHFTPSLSQWLPQMYTAFLCFPPAKNEQNVDHLPPSLPRGQKGRTSGLICRDCADEGASSFPRSF